MSYLAPIFATHPFAKIRENCKFGDPVVPIETNNGKDMKIKMKMKHRCVD